MLAPEEVLTLHQEIVSIPSLSGSEARLADYLEEWLRVRSPNGSPARRIANTLLLTAGSGPIVLLDTHLDTVPPASGWTRDPFRPRLEDGRVYGLGANDAKASVAAMIAAFLAVREERLPFTLALALVEAEETRGTGTQAVLAELGKREEPLVAALLGEPTGLDVAAAQKGLLVLELLAKGEACHAAHAAALGARNAAFALAADLVALEGLELGPAHPRLGRVTVQPTVLRAGTARNVVPGEASAILDVRTVPGSHREVVDRLQAGLTAEVRVLSDRLVPRETAEDEPVVRAALAARPGARLYGSATLSDMVFMDGVPAVKCGPGRSERSHTPDEFVLEEEILDGVRFYTDFVRAFAAQTEAAGSATAGGGAPFPPPRGERGRGLGGDATMSRLWDKGEPLDPLVLRYTAEEDVRLDQRLVAHEARASLAHAEMLHQGGLLTADDLVAIRQGLETLAAEHAAGAWQVELEDEDLPTALERRLTARIGEAGARIHLGRSRNDQVLASLRLYILDAAEELARGALAVATALDRLAEDASDIELPGYTHLQRAMPSSVPLWAGGFAAALRDDAEGLRAVERRASRNPLGSAAGYGVPSSLPIDREATRRALGFRENEEPVTAVQLARGKAEAHLLFEIALLLQDLGRLGAELVLFASQEFGFVELAPQFTTGSSVMPQKRNPDVFELVRGRSAAGQSCLLEALAITAKLPSGYHRDLQLLKAPLFRGIDLARDTCAVVAVALGGVRFRRERISLDPQLFAAEEAYRLVIDEGIPFREAYRRVAARLRES